MNQNELCHKDKGLGKLCEITPLNLTEHFKKKKKKKHSKISCTWKYITQIIVCGLRQVKEVMRLVLEDASPTGYWLSQEGCDSRKTPQTMCCLQFTKRQTWVNIQINLLFLYFMYPNVFAARDPFNIWAMWMTL